MDYDEDQDYSGPYKPIWARPGNTKIETRIEVFVDRCGNKATVTHVVYRNKKGKLREVIGFVQWEHLNDPPSYNIG